LRIFQPKKTRLKFNLSVFLFFFLITSCGSKKIIYNQPEKKSSKKIEKNKSIDSKKPNILDTNTQMKVYVLQYSDLAIKEMNKFGIPASIKLAQALLESQAGKGELALKSNNHFGIKCHKGWKGSSVSHDDDAKGECFRKYKKVEISFRDHSEFLRYRDRYSELFRFKKTDYIKWAHGLKKAGYATDPKYAFKLISLIERFELWRFDGSKNPLEKSKIKSEGMYIVKKGDTLYSISKKFGKTVQFLKKLNNLKNNILAVGQEIKLQ